MEFRLPGLERRLDLIRRVAEAANPLSRTVLGLPVVQHVTVGVDLQHVAVDREDLLQRRTELKESGSVVESVEQVNIDSAVGQVEREESKGGAQIDR